MKFKIANTAVSGLCALALFAGGSSWLFPVVGDDLNDEFC